MKIKSWFMRIFRGWFPVEPKKSNLWSKNRLRFLGISIIVASMVTFVAWSLTVTSRTMPLIPLLEVPTVESDYLPGVSVGDYVTYGNFVCNISHPTGPEWDWMPNLGDVDWQKVEVIGVSGKEVTLRYTEQFKNGSATSHNGCVHVIENIEYDGLINGTCQFQDYYFGSIIVANLTEGDCIHSDEYHPMPFCNIAKTESRTYLGVGRWVNIINSTNNDPTQVIWVYDGFSGMLLEYQEIIPNNERISYSIIETNIFSTPAPSPVSSFKENKVNSIPTEALYATTGPLEIVFFVVTMTIFRKRRLKGGENDKE